MMNDILDNAPCYYFSFTDNGQLISINNIFCDQLHYKKEELHDKLLDSIFTIPSRIFYQTHWRPLLHLQGQVNELYITFAAKDKSILPVLVNSTRKEVDGVFVNECVGILVANRKKYEDELLAAKKAYESALSTNNALINAQQELKEHALQLDKSLNRLQVQNDELRQINKIITHDLQEPIRKLSFYSDQLTAEGSSLPDDVIKNITLLQKVTLRFRTILSGLQQYIWLTEMEELFTDVDLNLVLAEAIEELRQRFKASDYTITVEPLPVIRGNYEQLLAMLVHILDNAVRFRKTGEAASIAVRSTLLEQNSLRNIADRYLYSKYVRITIADNGIGFDNSLNNDVFALFYKMNNIAGAGLGLSLSKKVASYHQGTAEAQSEPGKGTTITIVLPLNLMK